MNSLLVFCIGIFIGLVTICTYYSANARSVCSKSTNFNVCDKNTVCVKPNKKFCKKFPNFSPECNHYGPDIDISCPEFCEEYVGEQAKICYTASACASRGADLKWTEAYEDCNKHYSVLKACESGGCPSFSCRDPPKICPAQCEKENEETGRTPSFCYGEEGCKARNPEDGIWAAPFDNCNTSHVATKCSQEMGCPWASCPQPPKDLCQPEHCNEPHGECNQLDGSCNCLDGFTGDNCGSKPPPGPASCDAGRTYGVGGVAPCNKCLTCTAPQVIDSECTINSNSTCKDGPPTPVGCDERCITPQEEGAKSTKQCFDNCGDPATSFFIWDGSSFSLNPVHKESADFLQGKVDLCNKGITNFNCTTDSGCDWATCS
jgi:hypothetical protein